MFPNNDLPVPSDARFRLPNGDRSTALDSSPPAPDDSPINAIPTHQLAKTHYIFVDLENVQPKITINPAIRSVKLKIFVGKKQDKVPLDLVLAAQAYGPDAEYIQVDGQAQNALDFYITYYIGHLVGTMGGQVSDVCFHIISKDRGFDPLISHLKAKNIFCHRSRSFEEIPFDGVLPRESASRAASRKTGTATSIAASLNQLDRIKQNLAKRKAGKPRSLSALQGTIKSLFANQLAGAEIQSLIDQLVHDGVLSVSQNKVTYGGKQPAKKKAQALPRQVLKIAPTLQSQPPEPAFNPSDHAAAVTAYRDFVCAKLKCDIPPLDTRQRIYAILDARLSDIARDREPMPLGDLSTLIANALASTVPGLPQTTVFKLLYSLFRVRAFETEPSTRPFNPNIVASKRGDAVWDDL